MENKEFFNDKATIISKIEDCPKNGWRMCYYESPRRTSKLKLVVSAHCDTVIVRDAATSAELRRFPGRGLSNYPNTLDLSAELALMATGTSDSKHIEIIDIDNDNVDEWSSLGQIAHTFANSTMQCRFNAKRQHLVTVAAGELVVSDMSTPSFPTLLKLIPGGHSYALCFSRDETLLALGTGAIYDYAAIDFSQLTEQEKGGGAENGSVFNKKYLIKTVETPSSSAWNCEFSTDDRLLAYSSDESFTRLFLREKEFERQADVVQGGYGHCCRWVFPNVLAVTAANMVKLCFLKEDSLEGRFVTHHIEVAGDSGQWFCGICTDLAGKRLWGWDVACRFWTYGIEPITREVVRKAKYKARKPVLLLRYGKGSKKMADAFECWNVFRLAAEFIKWSF